MVYRILLRNYANLKNVGAIKIFIVYSIISSCQNQLIYYNSSCKIWYYHVKTITKHEFLYYKYHLAMKHAKDVGLMHPRKSRSIKHRHAEQRWIIITYTNYIAKHTHDTLTFLIQTDWISNSNIALSSRNNSDKGN